jgi:DNA-binding IclR family transcriptional regulator
MHMASKPDYSAPALEKGLDILEALSGSPGPLTLSALARLLGRGNNEIFRMLNLLEERRYILRDEAGAYRLSLRLFQIAHSHSPVRRMIETAEPAMRELVRATSESCHLSVLEGAEIVVLSSVECPQPVRLSIAVGARFDVVRTASGRALLSSLSKGRRAGILGESPAFRAMTATDKKKFLASLISAAKRGVATASNETISGVLDAAIPVGSPDSGIYAAIAISALTSARGRRSAEEFLKPLEACAQKINLAIGACPPAGPLGTCSGIKADA